MKYSLLKIKKMGSRLLLLLFKMKKRRGFNFKMNLFINKKEKCTSKWRRVKKSKEKRKKH